jgi:hypothetical protein
MKDIRNIVAAWEKVTTNCMNSSWKKLWPKACHDFGRFEENEAAVTNDIVLLANQLGMDEVDIDNVRELLQSHQRRAGRVGTATFYRGRLLHR